MRNASRRKSLAIKTAGFSSAFAASLVFAQNVIAQTSTTTTTTTKGGTATALPAAGTVELTYFIFAAGIILFVIGTIKLALSFRE